MAKNILTMSAEEFEKIAYKISSKQLKTMLKAIYELKWESGKNWPEHQIADIERKESKIWRILQERGYLTKANNNDFRLWLKGMNFKKRSF